MKYVLSKPLKPQEVLFSLVCTDCQWPSLSLTELVETVLMQVQEPDCIHFIPGQQHLWQVDKGIILPTEHYSSKWTVSSRPC